MLNGEPMSQRVDYDRIAAGYETRYERNDYTGIEHALRAFVGDAWVGNQRQVLEVGCGAGHWVHILRDSATAIVGLDPSAGMLRVARTRLVGARLIRARAEALPCRASGFDRVFCVNALHHFTDPAAFLREARRVLVTGGGLLTIGLDPHTGRDRWWIYDYVPSGLIYDRRRYPAAERIRALMEGAGFSGCETREVQHLPAHMTVSEAARRGFLDRTSTSQLMVISQAEYDAGVTRIHRADADAGGAKILRADLRVYATTAWVA
jgi:SAM-dependent methyltransferase